MTTELELIQEAINKAKQIIQEAEHMGTIEMKDDLTGEEVKVKRPKKNPAEEKVENLQIEGYGHAGSDAYFGKIDRKHFSESLEENAEAIAKTATLQALDVMKHIVYHYHDTITKNHSDIGNQLGELHKQIDEIALRYKPNDYEYRETYNKASRPLFDRILAF
jgi:hypothetical protein